MADTHPRRQIRSARHRRRVIVRALMASTGLVLVGVVVVAAFAWSTIRSAETAMDDLGELPDYAGRPAAPADGSVNLLLLGSDSRRPLDVDELTDAGPQRADTVMVAHVAADRRSVDLMSIPRDTWVDVPGHGPAKVNAALAWGGAALEARTIEELTGARVDHVAVVDFSGVQSIVATLGAVRVENEVAFTRNGRVFAEGPLTLDGPSALDYVRERHAFADGDFQRMRNQQALVAGIADRLLSTQSLTDPARVAAVVQEAAGHVGVDDSWTTGDMIGLAVSLRHLRSTDVTSFTMPVTGTATSPDGQSIVTVDEASLAEVRRAFADDDLTAISRQGR